MKKRPNTKVKEVIFATILICKTVFPEPMGPKKKYAEIPSKGEIKESIPVDQREG